MSEETPVIPPEVENKLAELSILKASLDDAKKQSAEYYDQLLRLKAEFENFRRRSEKEKAEARQYGKQDVLMPLLGLVDVFEQAMSQARTVKEVTAMIQGLEFLYKNFASFLRSEGLEPIELMGKPFDPHLAEAIEQVEVDDAQAGQVIGEIQKGYLFQGRVLRPSRVRVGVAKSGQTAAPEAQ
jgi:molecular chaperone GrpE